MAFFKSALSHLSHKPTHVVANNVDLHPWFYMTCLEATRFVRKVEICNALAAGDDAWGTMVEQPHHHTLLRVFLAPASGDSGTSEEVLLIERVLSTNGAYHSVAPIKEPFSAGGSLFHPEVHDRVCSITHGPSTVLAHDLNVERTIVFGDASRPHLALAEFAQVIHLISRVTTLICAGGDCKYQSRSFAFTCMAALTPTLPPSTFVRKSNEVIGMNMSDGAEAMDDSVFELTAESFLGQVPWLVSDPSSNQAIGLIKALKNGPRATTPARLYH